MGDALKVHDCFGAILRSSGGEFTLLSAETGKPFATLDAGGLHVQKGSGKQKTKNTVALKALKTLIAAIEKEAKA